VLTFVITHFCQLQKVMAVKLTTLTHKIAIQLHLVAESCSICRSRSRRTFRKLFDTSSYTDMPCLLTGPIDHIRSMHVFTERILIFLHRSKFVHISSRGLLGCDAVIVLVGYQRFRGPCCLHLQGEVSKLASYKITLNFEINCN
jgi:hypothetical protein